LTEGPVIWQQRKTVSYQVRHFQECPTLVWFLKWFQCTTLGGDTSMWPAPNLLGHWQK